MDGNSRKINHSGIQPGSAPPGTLTRIFHTVAVMSFNTFLLFLVLNIVAYALLSLFHDGSTDPARFFYTPGERYDIDRDSFLKLYGNRSDDDIDQLLDHPVPGSHPTLELMQTPVESRHYNVGYEGMRYTSRVNASNAESMMNGSTWIFGGSTTFGHGVSDDETIPAYLNELDTASACINFAFQAAHQNLEIEKLLLLLRKGYRPKKVIFIDGLNDITAMGSSNFHPVETPTRLRNAYGYLTNIETLRTPPVRFLLERFPLFRFVFTLREEGKREGLPSSVRGDYDDIYGADDLYHRDPVLHYGLRSSFSGNYEEVVKDLANHQGKLLDYYRLNGRFLDEVARAFDFEYVVFFQPLGNLNLENPFLKDPDRYRQSPHFRYYSAMASSVKVAIREGKLPRFYDISDLEPGCRDCYIDLTHYSPRFCRVIARRIRSVVSPGNP